MFEADIESSGAETDISDLDPVDVTETQQDTPPGSTRQTKTSTQEATPGQDGDENADDTEVPSPFKNGKEKFVINGKEREWDWKTTRKYAQLGLAGQQALERAATIEQKAKSTYSRIVELAETDPEGLLRTLNPKFKGLSSRAAQPAKGGQGQGEEQDQDPSAARIAELEERLRTSEDRFEQMDIDAERKAIEGEIDAAAKEYPEIQDKIVRQYVKAQYKSQLQKGLTNVTLEDVAFHVAQEIREKRTQEAKDKQARLKTNRDKAPVNAVPGAGGDKPMSREDVYKLAGRI